MEKVDLKEYLDSSKVVFKVEAYSLVGNLVITIGT